MQTIAGSRQIVEILELLSTEPVGYAKRKAHLPTFFMICFWAVCGSTLISLIVASLALLGWIPWTGASVWSFRLLGFGELGALTMSISTAYSFPKEISKPLARVRSSAIQLDHLRLLKLRTFASEDLLYLSERLQLEAEQLRSRVGLAVGALDKVGIVPLLVGSVYTFWKFDHEANLRLSFVAPVLAGLTVLYAMGLLFTVRGHRADQLAQLLKLAASESDRSADLAPTSPTP